MKLSLLFLALLAWQLPQVAPKTKTAVTAQQPHSITLGQSVVPLNGPWKFHTGDDPRWAGPDWDDSDWEMVDLTPLAGAHDADVGLTGYVPGWTATGHPGYSGYAWYRMRISVAAPVGESLALAGPADVDDAYEIFWNGALLGGVGAFSSARPSVYSILPRTFPLPQPTQSSAGQCFATAQTVSGVVAFRVWMAPATVPAAPDVGGIHIAPLVGGSGAISTRQTIQWLELFRGYVVDVIEPGGFVLLAIMAFCLFVWSSADSGYLWLTLALLLLALARGNLAFFSWTQVESALAFEIVQNVLLIPLGLGTWTIAWGAWLRVRERGFVTRAAGTLTLVFMASQFCSSSFTARFLPHGALVASQSASATVRLLFAALLVLVVLWGIRQRGREGWLTLPAVALLSVGLFAQELSAVHVPSIWFPFGTGVSRTQFVYPIFDMVLFALLIRRLGSFARGNESTERPALRQ